MIAFSVVTIAVGPANIVVAVSRVWIRALSVVARTAAERPCIIVAVARARLRLPPIVITIAIAGTALDTTRRVGPPLVISRIEVSRIEVHDRTGVTSLRPRRS